MKRILLSLAAALMLAPAEHIAAIKAHGYSPEHRRSFHPKELELTLF